MFFRLYQGILFEGTLSIPLIDTWKYNEKFCLSHLLCIDLFHIWRLKKNKIAYRLFFFCQNNSIIFLTIMFRFKLVEAIQDGRNEKRNSSFSCEAVVSMNFSITHPTLHVLRVWVSLHYPHPLLIYKSYIW